MRAFPAILSLLLLTVALAHGDDEPSYPDPTRFEKAITDFEFRDQRRMPEPGGIVFVGSSSMKGWRWQIEKHLAPLSVIPRGFGGSNMHDTLHYADRVILAYKPRAVVIYQGDNDVALGISPATIVETLEALIGTIHAAQPETRIYIMSVKPSPRRWHLWPQMQATNTRFARLADANEHVTYLDIATPMLGDDGKPKPEIFKEDELHMELAGYEIWRDAVRPILLKQELQHEPKTAEEVAE